MPNQNNPMILISNDNADDDQSAIESNKTTNSLADEILLQIDYLYSTDGNDDFNLIDDNEDTQYRNDDDDDVDDDLQDIKNTIENALS